VVRSTREGAYALMRFRILGSLEVLVDERQLPLGGARQREVLAILLLHRGEAVSVDRVVDELWGQRPPETATKTVQVYVSRLRKEFGDGVLVTRGGGYALEIDGEAVDADRFERLVDEGRAALDNGDARGACRSLADALELWRGPPLADVAYESFAQNEVARLEELRLVALETRGEANLALGRHAALVPELEVLVREHPTRERLREELMLALYRSGRQVDALERYRDAQRTLVEELGLEPGPQLQQLERSILTHDPAIETPPAGGAVAALRRRRRGGMLVALGGALLLTVAIAAVVVGTGNDQPSTIGENAVGLIDPDSGELSEQFAVGRGPSAAAVGAGSVWVANRRDGTVSRVDADTRQITTIDVGGDPSALAFGGGSLWVTSAERRGVAQIDPGTNRVLRTIPVGNTPGGVAVAFGAVWVATAVDGTVTRIDLARGRPTKAIAVGASPTAIAAGAGALWVASEASGSVVRIEAGSGRVVNAINVGNGPGAVAFGEGAVWVANRQDGTVSRIDPATNVVTETVRVGSEPKAIAAGEGGVWVANGGEGTLTRIDPDARRVSKTIDIGGSPSALVVADGSVWPTALASAESHRGGTLRLTWPPYDKNPCRCADPIVYNNIQSWWLASLAYDGLVAYRRVGGAGGATLVGDLAAEVPEPSADGRTYVFQLRRGIRFSNGAPVRPEDFRHSLQRFFRLNDPDASSSYFDGVLGARRCRTQSRGCDLSKGIETDPKAGTITIHLRAPDPDILHALTLPHASVVPSDSPMRFARRRPLPGTGPYRIASFDPLRGGRLVRNRHFRVWSQDARPDGFADEITIDVGAKIDAQLAAVSSGEADTVNLSDALWEGALQPARVRELAIRYGGRLHSAAEPQVEFMGMNVRSPPFDDVRVRRALNYAVDRGDVAELAGGPEIAQPTCQLLPPGFQGYRPFCRYTVNPNPAGTWAAPDWGRAKRLVRESGTKGSRVRILVERRQQPLGRYFASLLRRLGYRSSVLVLGAPAYWYAITAPPEPVNMWWFGWVTDYLAPSAFVQALFSCAALGPQWELSDDFGPFCDRGIDAQMERAHAQQSSDLAAANALWESVDRRLADAAPAVPLFNRQHLTLVSDRVENVQHHPLSGVLTDQLWVR
jgi:YVTN family beta-propeller protein